MQTYIPKAAQNSNKEIPFAFAQGGEVSFEFLPSVAVSMLPLPIKVPPGLDGLNQTLGLRP